MTEPMFLWVKQKVKIGANALFAFLIEIVIGRGMWTNEIGVVVCLFAINSQTEKSKSIVTRMWNMARNWRCV